MKKTRLPWIRPMAASLLFGLALLTFLFTKFPWDGMIINDAWRWYMPSSLFQWPAGSEMVFRQDGAGLSWATLVTRRGLALVWWELIRLCAVGDPCVFINRLCILVEVINLGLFAHIAWRLAGPRRLYPIMLAALLYPFAAQSRFWQDMIKSNLAATFFLLSFGMFLYVIRSRRSAGLRWVLSAASLFSYWLSILTHEFALCLSPIFLYLALFYANEGRFLLRFKRWRSFSTGLGACFIGLTLLAVFLLTGESPTYLLYGERFKELSTMLGVPAAVVAFMIISAHMVFAASSAFLFNTLGILLYPLLAVWRDRAVVTESWGTLAAIILLGAAAAWLWRLAGARPGPQNSEAGERNRGALLVIVGGAWAALAYLPFLTALGYPRIVGLMADRENILAMWGVALVLGELGYRFSLKATALPRLRATFYPALALVVAILVSHLHIQKEYYVEAYRKEHSLATLILQSRIAHPADGRIPVILLERKKKTMTPRARLKIALKRGEGLDRGLAVASFLTDRYFTGEYLLNGFDLRGISMFGCCPGAAAQTFLGHALRQGVPFVPVFTIDVGFHLEQDSDEFRVGYPAFPTSSTKPGQLETIDWSVFPKRQYHLKVLELGESVFRLRGPLVYTLRDDS